MAVAVTVTRRDTAGGRTKFIAGTLAFDSSYPTGGEPLTAETVGFSANVDLMLVAPSTGLMFEYDHTNEKVIAYYPTGGATAAPTTLAAPGVTTGASTASAVNATTPAITPGQAKEVGSTADLSSVTAARFVAWGY